MPLTVAKSHVFITGGSSGIGLALAEEFIRSGARSVSIAARSVDKLDSAQRQLDTLAASLAPKPSTSSASSYAPAARCQVRRFVADVSDSDSIGSSMRQAESESGPIDFLVCCAGAASPGHCIDMDLSVFERQMKVNYLGAVAAVKHALPGMVERDRGAVVLVSSILGLFGISGYSAYCPSKYALRGFAECLRSELQGTRVQVMIGYPPDTDTPGFHLENKTKPPETVEISQDGALFAPDVVAKTLMKGIKRGSFHLPTPDWGQWFIVLAQTGLTPRAWNLVLEALIAPLVVIILRIFGWTWDRIVRRHRSKQAYGTKSSPAPNGNGTSTALNVEGSEGNLDSAKTK